MQPTDWRPLEAPKAGPILCGTAVSRRVGTRALSKPREEPQRCSCLAYPWNSVATGSETRLCSEQSPGYEGMREGGGSEMEMQANPTLEGKVTGTGISERWPRRGSEPAKFPWPGGQRECWPSAHLHPTQHSTPSHVATTPSCCSYPHST